MPCRHKFQDYLNLDLIDFAPTTLIVGTFNPDWPEGNNAQWFYGRTQNNYFWDILPGLYGLPSLINEHINQWKQFCHDHQIALTDLIRCICDANEQVEEHIRLLENYSDSNIANEFEDHSITDIILLLRAFDSITSVYLTRGANEPFWSNLWNPIADYCSNHGIHCRTLLTPSSYARFQLGPYNEEHPDNPLGLNDYILMRWQAVWHDNH